MRHTYAKNSDIFVRPCDRSICSIERKRSSYPVDGCAITAKMVAVKKCSLFKKILVGIIGWLATPISGEAAADHGPWVRL